MRAGSLLEVRGMAFLNMVFRECGVLSGTLRNGGGDARSSAFFAPVPNQISETEFWVM